MDNKTSEYTLLSNFERKADALECSSCLLSANTMGISLAVDARRLTKYFEALLEQWRGCLPLGDAYDVNFSNWGAKVWEMIEKARYTFSLNGVLLNQYEYESDCYLLFKEQQDAIGPLDGNMIPFQTLSGKEPGIILVCALRELSEILMAISEFLSSPTEEQIANSFEQWKACYMNKYHEACFKKYQKWKIQFTARTVKKHLQDRIKKEIEMLRKIFLTDDEFDMVFDSEQRALDVEGVSRFLFTNAERFGVSHIGSHPMFSKELLRLFYYVDTWYMMQADLQPKKKQAEKSSAPVVDELEVKVNEQLGKICHLATVHWKLHLPKLWKRIFTNFRSEIAKAGSREKFQEFSKKTLYCIIGHLKSKGVYQQQTSNLKLTTILEGENNGMRKYLNNGLLELEASLKERLESFVDQEMKRLVPEVQ